MHAEQSHGDDIEDGHGRVLKSADDVGAHVHVAVRQGVQRQHAADGQMEHMEDDEGGDDGAAPDHGAGGVAGGHVVLLNVSFGAGLLL